MGEQPGVLGAAPGEQWLRCRGWRSTGQSAGPREGKPRPFQECSAQAWAGGGHREECLGVEGLWSPWGWYGFVQTHHADPGCWAVCLRLDWGTQLWDSPRDSHSSTPTHLLYQMFQ